MKYFRAPEYPPQPEGMSLSSITLLEVPEFDQLLLRLEKIHHDLAHITV